MRITELIDAVAEERVRLDRPRTERTEKEAFGRYSNVKADIASDGSAAVVFKNAGKDLVYYCLEDVSPADVLVLARFFLRVYGKMTGEIK